MIGDKVKCIICGKEFIQIRHHHKMCSTSCREERKLEYTKEITKSRFIIFERDNFKCVYCGRSSIEHGVLLNVDHIIPKVKGGKHSIYNTVTACKECNMDKGNNYIKLEIYERILEELIKRNKGISYTAMLFVKRVFTEHFGLEFCSEEQKGKNSIAHKLMKQIKELEKPCKNCKP
jgi:hypothetical protein